MDFESNYDIAASAQFIHTHNFTRVALQFPDHLLKDSTRVVTALRKRLQSLKKCDATGSGHETDVGLFVMADTAYGSCCVDEVGASHINADCVIHYGHTCFSPTTTLPAFFVFGKASICVADCVESMSKYALANSKPIMVLFGLEYAHSMQQIKEALLESSMSCRFDAKPEVHFANVPSSVMFPSKDIKKINGLQEQASGASGTTCSIGGLTWKLPEGQSMDDYLLFWIGLDDSAFANVVLTFNACEIVRYDANEKQMVTDLFQQRRILKRRYYLVERAKDANIVGILVGTLGVAGYLHIINQMMELITGAGKKAYTLVMGRPNPAKLANFPECDVFLYVSCAQTALLDSKEYLAPVITPFEAMIAFNRGSQWTGAYVMEFRDLINLPEMEVIDQEEARFSFLKGGYVEDFENQENVEEEREVLSLVNATEKALQLRNNSNALMKGNARSGAEFLANRSYQGLNMPSENNSPEPYLIGRRGRASGYEDEKNKQ
ncbi:2-(3-amino-3-carboxypropyl)histidine synthase subunit 2 isoform X2 [Cajanus cajan]|uniref:2-(3-amino-3-carboxypropyl)histidine synthase subunit 2 n=2 Tax=Cajanus cajan TaxID=3821 RepID=A0A151SPP4_CAJCA|nr:2-(3-amino-3-carboxypropyl)histidine synthase subunit 2 isoform X2 [Cajanus cajan]XP_020227461.1 2-(3-amino-3-carboxypropyl)histidine synthase subunit 2 isoform X2 [Cajanus cajan]KYP56804.1 Diphthamide biosynthesis protein 2 [Cajanus cajan]